MLRTISTVATVSVVTFAACSTVVSGCVDSVSRVASQSGIVAAGCHVQRRTCSTVGAAISRLTRLAVDSVELKGIIACKRAVVALITIGVWRTRFACLAVPIRFTRIATQFSRVETILGCACKPGSIALRRVQRTQTTLFVSSVAGTASTTVVCGGIICKRRGACKCVG